MRLLIRGFLIQIPELLPAGEARLTSARLPLGLKKGKCWTCKLVRL